jgi:hypothetical protein
VSANYTQAKTSEKQPENWLRIWQKAGFFTLPEPGINPTMIRRETEETDALFIKKTAIFVSYCQLSVAKSKFYCSLTDFTMCQSILKS